MGLQIVQVRARAVQLLADVVAGAMREVLAKAGCADHRAGRVVGLEAMNLTALGEGLLEIALVLSSLYFISRKKMFPVIGVVAGIAGVAIAVTGLLS